MDKKNYITPEINVLIFDHNEIATDKIIDSAGQPQGGVETCPTDGACIYDGL